MLTIIGVFSDDNHLGAAVKALSEMGIENEHLKVIDNQQRTPGSSPTADSAAVSGTANTTQYGSSIAFVPLLGSVTEMEDAPAQLRTWLSGQGVPRDMLNFCVDALQHDADLLLVQVEAENEERQNKVRDILKKSQAEQIA